MGCVLLSAHCWLRVVGCTLLAAHCWVPAAQLLAIGCTLLPAQCLQDCDEAIEKGRELRADYKLIGRAYTRRGNALAKMGRLEEAVEAYQKALTEHR